jgi:hypothetical protein
LLPSPKQYPISPPPHPPLLFLSAFFHSSDQSSLPPQFAHLFAIYFRHLAWVHFLPSSAPLCANKQFPLQNVSQLGQQRQREGLIGAAQFCHWAGRAVRVVANLELGKFGKMGRKICVCAEVGHHPRGGGGGPLSFTSIPSTFVDLPFIQPFSHSRPNDRYFGIIKQWCDF